MIVRWTETAFEDLQEIAEFIARDKPEAARRVVERIYQAVSALQTHPMRGRLTGTTSLREIVVNPLPYIVLYRVGEEVEVIRILHGAQHHIQ